MVEATKTIAKSYRRGKTSAKGTVTQGGRRMLSITFTNKQITKVNRFAKEQEISFAEAVRQSVDQYIAG